MTFFSISLAPAESTQKPSSLRSKVKAREERQRERENMLSELTAPTVPVEGVSQLRAAAGKNPWSAALVSMLLASTSHRAGQADRERLINVSVLTLSDILALCSFTDTSFDSCTLFQLTRGSSELQLGWQPCSFLLL